MEGQGAADGAADGAGGGPAAPVPVHDPGIGPDQAYRRRFAVACTREGAKAFCALLQGYKSPRQYRGRSNQSVILVILKIVNCLTMFSPARLVAIERASGEEVTPLHAIAALLTDEVIEAWRTVRGHANGVWLGGVRAHAGRSWLPMFQSRLFGISQTFLRATAATNVLRSLLYGLAGETALPWARVLLGRLDGESGARAVEIVAELERLARCATYDDMFPPSPQSALTWGPPGVLGELVDAPPAQLPPRWPGRPAPGPPHVRARRRPRRQQEARGDGSGWEVDAGDLEGLDLGAAERP
jgi:hypothetical protein